MTQRILLGVMLAVWGMGVLLVGVAVGIGTLIRTQEITFTAVLNQFPVLMSLDVTRRLPVILVREPGALVYDGIWSPDGTRLAFIVSRNGDSEIYLLENGEWRQITDRAEPEQSVTWLPNGEQLMFFQQNEMGCFTQVDITTGIQSCGIGRDVFAAAWTIDGSHLAYSLWEGDITIIDVSSNTSYSISLPDFAFRVLSWSPDNTQLVFSGYSRIANSTELYRYTFSDGDIVPLTQTPVMKESDPSWSPDGTQIAFVGENLITREQHLYLLNLASGEIIQLSNMTAWGYPPSWRP